MTTDVLALHKRIVYNGEALAREGLLGNLLTEYAAAVRAETLAGPGVVEQTLKRLVEFVGSADPSILDAFSIMFPNDASLFHPEPTPPTPALTAARLAEAMREQHRPVPYHWSQSGESGTVCAGSIVGLHHRVERWPCDVESAILAALATPTPGGTR